MTKKKNKPIYFLVFIFACFGILVSLGIWQSMRYASKSKIIDQAMTNLHSKTLNYYVRRTNNEDLLKKYKLDGHFLNDKDILLYSSHPEKEHVHGYTIISPFQLSTGNIILVKRGWLAPTEVNKFLRKKQAAANANKDDHQMTVALIPHLSDERPNTPKSYQKNNSRNIWFVLNLEEARDSLNVNIETNHYMVAMEGDPLAKSLVTLPADKAINVNKNHHLGYAIMWFVLALIAAYIGFQNFKEI